MQTNLKPLLEPRKPKRSYRDPAPFDFHQTQTTLLTILTKLRNYLTSNALEPNLEVLNHLSHQALKQEVHEDLNKFIEAYVNHVTQEKLDEFLNSLHKESLLEDNQKLLLEFSRKLQVNVVRPLSTILELLHISVHDRDELGIDHDYIEAKVRKILHFIVYCVAIYRQQPQRILNSYCHMNYENLLAALIKEASVPGNEYLPEVVDFSVNRFKEDYTEGNAEIEKTCHQILSENSVDNNTQHVLNFLQKTINEIDSGSLEHAISDNNVKLDYIKHVNKEELRENLRRSLEGILKQQIEERITVFLSGLEASLKKTRENFSNLKNYFHTREESENYKKLIHGSYEHEISEAQSYGTAKALNTVKIYEDLMVEVFSNLTLLEKSKDEYAEVKAYVAGEVKKQFEELLGNARNSLKNYSPVGVLHQETVLDEGQFINSLKALIEKINPNAQQLLEKINAVGLKEKMNLVANRVNDELVIKNSDLTADPLNKHKVEPTPFYVYCIVSQVLILQVLDLEEGKGRVFYERDEGVNAPHGIQRVHLNVQDGLKRFLETIVECCNLGEDSEEVDVEKSVRELILALALFKIDTQLSEEESVHEIVLDKGLVQEFIKIGKIEKERKIPRENVEMPVEETAEEVSKQEEPAVEEQREEVVEQKEEKQDETVEEKREEEEAVENVENVENVADEEKKEPEETGNNEQKDAEVSEVSDKETQPTEQDVSEETKTQEQTQETNSPRNEEGEQEDETKKEEVGEKKEGEQKAGGASKNKKKKKKR